MIHLFSNFHENALVSFFNYHAKKRTDKRRTKKNPAKSGRGNKNKSSAVAAIGDRAKTKWAAVPLSVGGAG